MREDSILDYYREGPGRSWVKYANCIGQTDLFYSKVAYAAPTEQVTVENESNPATEPLIIKAETNSQRITRERAAKFICNQCDVRIDCKNYAIDTVQQDGIWGGLTPKELDYIRFDKES